jgi:hypothetical protein
METRRENLKIIGAIGVACAFPFSADELFAQEHEHPAAVEATPPGPFTPKFFTPDELKLVSRIADLIIPPTDTPGAVGAGVPRYIDYVASGDRALQNQLRTGLHLFGDFLALDEARQIAVLKPLSDAADSGHTPDNSAAAVFKTLKNLTCDGYYTSQVGLVRELGYSGNAARASFPACTG